MCDSDWPSGPCHRAPKKKAPLFQIQCLHFPLLYILVVLEWLSYFCGPRYSLVPSVALKLTLTAQD